MAGKTPAARSCPKSEIRCGRMPHCQRLLHRPGAAADEILILPFHPEMGRAVGEVGQHRHHRSGRAGRARSAARSPSKIARLRLGMIEMTTSGGEARQ